MKKLILVVIIAAVAGGLFYYLYWSPVYRIKPLNLIPSNTAFILASSEPMRSWKEMSDSDIWQHLKYNPDFEKITENANYLDSMFRDNEWLDFLGNKELLIAAHPVQDTYDYLYIMDLSKASRLQGIKYYLQNLLDESFQVTHRSFGDVEITEIYDKVEKMTVYMAFIENLVVVSLTPTLTESAILQYKAPDQKDIYFLEITDELGVSGLLRAYINYNGFMDYLGQFALDNPSMETLKHSLRYGGLTLSLQNDFLALNGFTNINDSVNSYFRGLYTSGKGSHDFLKVVPAYSPYFVSLGFKDFPTFVENLEHALDNNPEQKQAYVENRQLTEKFLKIDLDKSFIDWVDNEVVMLQTQPSSRSGVDEYAMLLKTKDPEKANNGLNDIRTQIKKRTPAKIKSITYKGHAIHYMAVKGFFKVFLGKLFDKFDRPYYSIVNNWVIFSNHPRTIKNIIDAVDDEATLFYDDGFQSHYKDLNRHTSVYAYVNTVEIFDDLRPLMEAEEWTNMKKNQEYVKCFTRISLQLTPEKEGMFSTGLTAQFRSNWTSTNDNQPVKVMPHQLPDEALPWKDKYEQALKELDRIVIPNLSDNAYKSYYDNETLQYDISIKNGWKHGRFQSYFKNGSLQFKGRYKDDKKDGIWRVYDKNGDLLTKLKYDEGELLE